MTKLDFYVNWATSTLFGLLHQRKYSAAWDAELNMLISANWSTAKYDRLTITLGDTEIWIGNEYYSYGYVFNWPRNKRPEYRPSLKTMFRLARLVEYLESQKCHA